MSSFKMRVSPSRCPFKTCSCALSQSCGCDLSQSCSCDTSRKATAVVVCFPKVDDDADFVKRLEDTEIEIKDDVRKGQKLVGNVKKGNHNESAAPSKEERQLKFAPKDDCIHLLKNLPPERQDAIRQRPLEEQSSLVQQFCQEQHQQLPPECQQKALQQTDVALKWVALVEATVDVQENAAMELENCTF